MPYPRACRRLLSLAWCFVGLAALALPCAVAARQGTRPRLDPSRVDPGGGYVEVRHPRVVRRDKTFTVAVVVDR
jgi:hypothetical protein